MFFSAEERKDSLCRGIFGHNHPRRLPHICWACATCSKDDAWPRKEGGCMPNGCGRMLAVSCSHMTKHWDEASCWLGQDLEVRQEQTWLLRSESDVHHGIAAILLLLSGARKEDITMMKVHTLK